ncbi:MAG: hypothetical protein EOP06_22670, partial [Proteobacteria bacterium]
MYEILDEVGIHVAQAGLEDLIASLPYTLTFVKEVESIDISSSIYSIVDESSEMLDPSTRLTRTRVHFASNDKFETVHSVVTLSTNLTTIALPAHVNGKTVKLLSVSGKTPKLHCDFPLVGTEAFPFPTITNSPAFNPTDSRDGIFLEKSTRYNQAIEENKSIMREAQSLYLKLLQHATSNKWLDIHLMAQGVAAPSNLEWVDDAWYKREILEPIRDSLLRSKIVSTADGNIAAILDADGKNFVFFPFAEKKSARHAIWRCCASWIPHCLPKQEDLDFWSLNIWEGCGRLTLNQIAKFIEGIGSIQHLEKQLIQVDVYDWLNEMYSLYDEDETAQAVLYRHKVFPNQHGTFCNIAELREDAGDIDNALLDILQMLGRDIRAEMLSTRISRAIQHHAAIDQA